MLRKSLFERDGCFASHALTSGVPWVAVLTFEGDKISAIDELYDNCGTMIQLGLAQ